MRVVGALAIWLLSCSGGDSGPATNSTKTTPSPPASWSCSAANYGAEDGCHCGCGASDPDCAQVDAMVLGCGNATTPWECSAAGACVDPCGGVSRDGECSGTVLRRCIVAQDGSWQIEVEYCPDPQLCSIDDGKAHCAECATGEAACTAPNSLKTCHGGAWTHELCGKDELCIDEPDENDATCGCVFEASYCDDSGQLVSCQDGTIKKQSCETGTCVETWGYRAGCFTDAAATIAIAGSVEFAVPAQQQVPVAGQTLPISHAVVAAIVDDRLAGRAVTDSAGNFQLNAQFGSAQSVTLVLLGATLSDAGHPRVLALEHLDASSVWRRSLGTVPTSVAKHDLGPTVIDGDGAAVWYALWSLQQTMDWAEQALEQAIAPVKLVYDDPLGGHGIYYPGSSSGIAPASGQIEIDAAQRWNHSLLAHEAGHHVTDQQVPNFKHGQDSHGPSVHASLAASEGWADFVSAVAASIIEGGPMSSKYAKFDLETLAVDSVGYPTAADPQLPLDQNLNELIVAAILWDLADDTPEEDPVSLGFDAVLAAIALPHPGRGVASYDLVDFLDGLLCANVVTPGSMAALLAPYKLPYGPPPSCP